MSEWQPIETAPRDRKVIVIARQKPRGEWDVEAAWFVAEDDYPWNFIDGDGDLNGYRDDETGPTHWTTLPAPPHP